MNGNIATGKTFGINARDCLELISTEVCRKLPPSVLFELHSSKISSEIPLEYFGNKSWEISTDLFFGNNPRNCPEILVILRNVFAIALSEITSDIAAGIHADTLQYFPWNLSGMPHKILSGFLPKIPRGILPVIRTEIVSRLRSAVP